MNKKIIISALLILASFSYCFSVYPVTLVEEEEIAKPEIIKEEEPVIKSNVDTQVAIPKVKKKEEKIITKDSVNITESSKIKGVVDNKGSQKPQSFYFKVSNWIIIATLLLILKIILSFKIKKYRQEEEKIKEIILEQRRVEEKEKRMEWARREKEQEERRAREAAAAIETQKREAEEAREKIENAERKKIQILTVKYGQADGMKVYNKIVWVGMSVDQLIDSSGTPEKIKKRVRSTLYCYNLIPGPRGGEIYKHLYVIKNGRIAEIRTDAYA